MRAYAPEQAGVFACLQKTPAAPSRVGTTRCHARYLKLRCTDSSRHR